MAEGYALSSDSIRRIQNVVTKVEATAKNTSGIPTPKRTPPSEASTDKSFWGIITSCVKVGGVWTGSFKVRKLAGRLIDDGGLPKLDPSGVNGLKEVGTSDIEVYQGDGWHQVGDPVHCIPSGEGVTPAFIVEQRIGGTNHWQPPDVVVPIRPAGINALNEVQDVPNAIDRCP